MNTEPPPPSDPNTKPPPLLYPTRKSPTSSADTLEFQPLGKPATFLTVIEALLKQPGRVLHECKDGGAKVPVMLLIGAVLCLAVFGGLLGTFSGDTQYWASPAKVVGGVLVSLLICLPSLYIFSALGGMDARLSQVAGLLLAAIALTSLLLLGFAPVIWIFSQSTESVVFMGFLALGFWVISLFFGFRLLLAAAGKFGMNAGQYLVVWLLIFFLVTLQMSTALRPIIGTADTLLPVKKKFFMEHWFDEMGESAEASSKSKKSERSD